MSYENPRGKRATSINHKRKYMISNGVHKLDLELRSEQEKGRKKLLLTQMRENFSPRLTLAIKNYVIERTQAQHPQIKLMSPCLEVEC